MYPVPDPRPSGVDIELDSAPEKVVRGKRLEEGPVPTLTTLSAEDDLDSRTLDLDAGVSSKGFIMESFGLGITVLVKGAVGLEPLGLEA